MRHVLILLALLALAGCGGGGGGGGASAPFAATPAPTALPTNPPAGALSTSQSAVAFTAQGQATAVDVTEPGYSGNVGLETGSCAGIVTVTPPSEQPAPATYTITATGAGSCALAFVDRFGQHAPVAVGVTVTQGTVK